MKSLLILTIALSSFFNLTGQNHHIAQGTTSLDHVPIIHLPIQDNKLLVEEEMALRTIGRPNHFAVGLEVDINIKEDGFWEVLDDGTEVGRIQIVSAAAKSLNLGFSSFYMPEGASLVIYNPMQDKLIGPYGVEHNKDLEQLWTPLIFSDHIVIEVRLTSGKKENLKLLVSSVNHDFIGFGSTAASGSCNIDVLCDAADGYPQIDEHRDIIQSVGVYTLNGTLTCTGFLVNNVNNDFTPYFMTADHCGISAGNQGTIIVYWNYENSICRLPGGTASGGGGDGTLDNETASMGCTLRASSGVSDFCLVELDGPIHEDADAFFAGWTNEDSSPAAAICIHHPSTEEKRITFEDDPTDIGDNNGATTAGGNYVIVNDWDFGTTEGGSSGSPLFNPEGLVVGQLYGGLAACNNDDYDVFGRFFTSWNAGGPPSSSLQYWLDPDNNGVTSVGGLNSNYYITCTSIENQEVCAPTNVTCVLEVADLFASNVQLTPVGLPTGLSVAFSQNPVPPGGTTTITISGTGNLSAGNYLLSFEGTDNTNIANTDISVHVFNSAPASPSLQSPPNATSGVSTLVNFQWLEDSNAETYSIEVALDAAFTNIVATSINLTDPNYSILGSALTTYHWRVASQNICGAGNWSNAFSFTTADITCGLNSNNQPVIIDDGSPSTVTSVMNVTNGGSIIDLNVSNINGTHSYISDLTFELISPQGTSVILFTEICGSDENFNLGFDDASSNTMIPCPPTDGFTYLPVNSLSAFNGESSLGNWTLSVTDGFNQDGGSLDSWSLEICTGPDLSIGVITGTQMVCQGAATSFDISIGVGFENPITLSLSGNPAGSNFDFSPNPANPGDAVVLTIDNTIGIPEGNYNLTILGTDGTATYTNNAAMDIIGFPQSPVLQSPINGESVISIPVFFNWSNADGALDYEIIIATDPDLNNVVLTNYTNNNSQFTPNLNDLDVGSLYYWQVTTIGECGSTPSEINSFNNIVSTDDLFNDKMIHVFPNPTEGLLNIEIENAFRGEMDMAIYSSNGQLVQNKNGISEQLFSIDLDGQPSGIYLLKLIHEDFVVTKKISLYSF